MQVPRGGQATVHSPGQLVVYPCLRLRDFGLSPRCFVSKMEQVTQACLADFGIDAVKGDREPGLFVQGKKIAAFGFHISRGLTSHGIAINVANDLSLFDLIRTCGVARQPITSLADQGCRHSVADVFASWFERVHDDLEACP
ncbi:MAG: lipoyl(octanoyl) transferase LipB [Bdellovibrionales bacterium]|nr:lipoyl(octanoyl) transferase LipB [Bdellovibrionales bacterium]